MPTGWRPFDPARAEGLALRESGRLLGYCVVRPSEGMDAVDFLYVRPGARRQATFAVLLEPAVVRLRETGRTRLIYVGFGWWREGFPGAFARAFAAAGFGRFEGVFLVRPLQQSEGAPEPVAPGYEIADWRDERFEEVCEVMLASPEPEALYWDMGLCRRSILNAAFPMRPLFPDGFGQLATRDGTLVGFTLATQHGYVNHVYTHPDHRGRGLGSAMLSRLFVALARKGLTRATILTHDTNPRAIALYERLGFRVDFRYPQFYLRW
jgi:ribosomal protein S18 acetylase RimI-like enzyme